MGPVAHHFIRGAGPNMAASIKAPAADAIVPAHEAAVRLANVTAPALAEWLSASPPRAGPLRGAQPLDPPPHACRVLVCAEASDGERTGALITRIHDGLGASCELVMLLPSSTWRAACDAQPRLARAQWRPRTLAYEPPWYVSRSTVAHLLEPIEALEARLAADDAGPRVLVCPDVSVCSAAVGAHSIGSFERAADAGALSARPADARAAYLDAMLALLPPSGGRVLVLSSDAPALASGTEPARTSQPAGGTVPCPSLSPQALRAVVGGQQARSAEHGPPPSRGLERARHVVVQHVRTSLAAVDDGQPEGGAGVLPPGCSISAAGVRTASESSLPPSSGETTTRMLRLHTCIVHVGGAAPAAFPQPTCPCCR